MRKYELTELFVVDEWPDPPGSRFKIDDKWHEGDFLHCHVTGENGKDGFLGLVGIVEVDESNILLLKLPPRYTVDDPIVSVMVTRMLGPDSFEVISEQDLERIQEKCEPILHMERSEQVKGLKEFFGEFRAYVAEKN